jgi:integrase
MGAALDYGGLCEPTPSPSPPRTALKLPIRPGRSDQNERRLLLGSEWQGTDLVVERGDGGPIHPDLLSAAFRRLANRTGLAGVRLHDLRHFYASELLRANVHPKVVSDQLGHSSVAFTMDVYSHLMPSAGQSAAAAIEASLSFTK